MVTDKVIITSTNKDQTVWKEEENLITYNYPTKIHGTIIQRRVENKTSSHVVSHITDKHKNMLEFEITKLTIPK